MNEQVDHAKQARAEIKPKARDRYSWKKVRNRYDADLLIAGFIDGYEQAMSEIAARIEQQAHDRDQVTQLLRDGGSVDWAGGWDAATLAAAKIARSES